MQGSSSASQWPKTVPDLTPQQRRIQRDWASYWLEVLPERHGRVDQFSHTYAQRCGPAGGSTLEIGAGIGAHVKYEDLAAQSYHAVELQRDLAQALRTKYPQVKTIVADCQERLPFEEGSFDRVLAINVLEHLPNLPAALKEVRRILAPSGRFIAVIPCEGGFAYSLGRRLTVQRLFERRYGTSYAWHIESEHLNVPAEILGEIRERFEIVDRTFFPLRIPSVNLNLLIGITARARDA